MEVTAGDPELLNVALFDSRLAFGQVALGVREVHRGRLANNASDGQHLNERAQLIQFVQVFSIASGHDDASVWLSLEQPFRFEHAECFAHGRGAYVQPSGDVLLLKARAWRQRTREDLGA